jgi:hypothetical protein
MARPIPEIEAPRLAIDLIQRAQAAVPRGTPERPPLSRFATRADGVVTDRAGNVIYTPPIVRK